MFYTSETLSALKYQYLSKSPSLKDVFHCETFVLALRGRAILGLRLVAEFRRTVSLGLFSPVVLQG